MTQHAADRVIAPVPTLTTSRFTLRPLRRSDAAALLPTLGDEGQCLYLTRPAFASEEELWGWLADPDWDGRTWIAEDADGAVAARFVAVPQDEAGVEEIGYITCAERQGQGVARECMEVLVEHLFEVEQAQRLTAEVDAENRASIALLDRLGFARIAFHPAYEETHKGVCDVAIYALELSQYQETKAED